MFDPEQFLNTKVTEPSATRYLNPPDGAEGVGVISKVAAREVTSRNGDELTFLEVYIETDDPAITEKVKRPSWTGRYSIPLDLTEEGNLALGNGVNVKLGLLREAVGQNTKKAWSPSMLVGQAVRFKVGLRYGEDGQEYADITKVTSVK